MPAFRPRAGAAARLALLAAVATATPLPAQQPAKVAFTETTLANGLRVIVAEDHFAPVFTLLVQYDVGSRDERQGRTGFAHLFEHMMFKGSENVGDGEHGLVIATAGGQMNGTTNKDRTLYFQTLPANQLDLAIFLEADRMRSLDITQEKLDNQRHAVQEERRRNLDNQAYGRTNDALSDLVYDNPAYAHSTIGSMDDLNAATLQDVRDFFRTYYAPNNAVLVIVGAVDTAATIAKVRKAFEPIPSQSPPPRVDVTEPAQTAERRHVIEDPLARLPRLDIVYKVPPRRSPDTEPVVALGTILGSGRSSRLYRRLVLDEGLATSVFAARDATVGTGMFRIIVTPAAGKAPEAIERAVYDEIDKMMAAPPADWEVEKARNAGKKGIVSQMTSSLQRAIELAFHATAFGDPARINGRLAALEQLTAGDVQRVARAFLTPENRTVVTTMPAGKVTKPAAGDAGPKGGAR
jgi:predicted Zn-dependent peptidase